MSNRIVCGILVKGLKNFEGSKSDSYIFEVKLPLFLKRTFHFKLIRECANCLLLEKLKSLFLMTSTFNQSSQDAFKQNHDESLISQLDTQLNH